MPTAQETCTTPRGSTAQTSDRSIDSPPWCSDDLRPLLSPRSVQITDVFSPPPGPAAWAIIAGPSPGNVCVGRIGVEKLESNGVSFRALCRQRVAGAYLELLEFFSPMHERSRMASDTEYKYVPALSPQENELRRGLEIFSEWALWILSERENTTPSRGLLELSCSLRMACSHVAYNCRHHGSSTKES